MMTNSTAYNSGLVAVCPRLAELTIVCSSLVAVCPRLAELTIVCSSFDTRITTSKTLFDWVESTCSIILQLVIACKALPGFNTLRVVYFRVFPRPEICWCRELWCDGGGMRTI